MIFLFSNVSCKRWCTKQQKLLHNCDMKTIMEAEHQRTQRRSPAACPEPSHLPSPYAACPGWVGEAAGRRRGGGGEDGGFRGSHGICLASAGV